MIGILTPLLITISPNQMIQDIRNWEAEQSRTPVEEMLNNTLTEYEDGEDDTAKQEELLQLPSDRDQQSGGRGHDRCDDRSGVRPLQEGESESSGSGHPGEEDKGR